ncbi:hypothetical protein GG626_07540 [Salmonella enterica subsp. enterica serovar Ohio]|nr:hypothetical protein [Salmonella enterica subsp. enterica serovar Ohio]
MRYLAAGQKANTDSAYDINALLFSCSACCPFRQCQLKTILISTSQKTLSILLRSPPTYR